MTRREFVTKTSTLRLRVLPRFQPRWNLRAGWRHPGLVLGALGIVLVATMVLAMRLGTVTIEPDQIIAIICKRAAGLDLGIAWTPADESIIWQIRFPRV